MHFVQCDPQMHRFKQGDFTSQTGHSLKYSLYLPAGWHHNGRLPLAVVLTGMDTMGTDGRAPLKNPVAYSLYHNGTRQQDVPCVALFPQAEFAWDSSSEARQALKELVDDVIDQHNIDRRRVLLVGLADGARGAVTLASDSTDRWSGLVVVPYRTPVGYGTLSESLPVTWYGGVNTHQPSTDFRTPTTGDESVCRVLPQTLVQGNLHEIPGFAEWLSHDGMPQQ
jgi:pimeloyl-ACP methyl ester carboxylesterase